MNLILNCAFRDADDMQDEEFFHKIPEPTEDELDMLDLAFGLSET